MSKGKRYEILKSLEKEYRIVMSNREFMDFITKYYIKTFNTRHLFNLISKNGGGYRARPETMTPKPPISKNIKKEK